jgi:bifunctional non-homologous end joining protein LigD
VASAAPSLPNCIIDRVVCALDENVAADFAALQAALSKGKTDDLVYFAFDLQFAGKEDLRELKLTERKERLAALLARLQSILLLRDDIVRLPSGRRSNQAE